MKAKSFLFGLCALALVSCKDIDVPYVPEDTPDGTYDEAWYADNATVSSSDPYFDYTEEGEGEISFKAEGGSVVVYVDCGTEWTADDSEAGVFGCEVQETCITVTAGQNLAEEELYGTVTLMTAESQIQFATISITQNAYGAPEITVEVNEWHVPAVAADPEEFTTEIGVEATDEWSVECDAEWLTAEKGENSVSLTATENETFEERVATVVLTCTDGYNSDSETITVTQDARAYITLSAAELQFARTGGEATVTVESNYEWSYAYESDWFTVSESTDGSLTITVDVNGTGDDREGTVTFTAGDGAANVAETTLSITQSIEDPDALVLEYTIDTDGTEIELPLGERDLYSNEFAIDCTVDWGDGSEVETVKSKHPSHIYSVGIYNVIINGKVELLNSGDYDKMDYINGVECLTAVKQWGDTELRSMDSAFYGCSNLASLPEEPGPFSNVTSFYWAFGVCTSLTTLPENMLSNCTSATDFYGAFCYCSSLTSVPENLFANCPLVKDFEAVFFGCTSMTSVPENLFANCPSVESFDIVFCECTSLETVPVGIFNNNKSVTYFQSAFENCSSLVGESPYTMIDGNKVHLYERENYPEYFIAPEYYEDCFMRCTGLDDYYSIPYSWGGPEASHPPVSRMSLSTTDREERGPSRLGSHRDATRSHPTRK